MERIESCIKKSVLFCLAFYRLYLRSWMIAECRFHPHCSEYAREAYQNHPLGRATRLVICRLFRCRPFGGSGFDPVPLGGLHNE